MSNIDFYTLITALDEKLTHSSTELCQELSIPATEFGAEFGEQMDQS
jgi:hypothetical protein